ncbi:MAG: hypothetical protein RR711_11030 [Bacteroides sp.]
MKKNLLLSFICFSALLVSCSKDNEENKENLQPIALETDVCQIVPIHAPLDWGSTATYEWSIESAPAENYSLTGIHKAQALFLAASGGTYQLKLKISNGERNESVDVTINVKEPTTSLSPYIAKVYDLLPAPGQFTNSIPEYKPGDTQSAMIEKAESYLVGKKNGGLVSLGGFGGYIVFGFDHTVVNVKGKRDIRVMGNAFYSNANPQPDAPKGGSCEPGIIMVSQDANKNGIPDDEWYEIAGSEYAKPTSIKNYEITYYRPTSEEATENGGGNVTIKNYIRWEDNQGNSGYKVKNSFHAQSYYPSWIKEDKITFKGTLLPDNAIDESGEGTYWVLYAYGYGYADNALNSEEDSAFDIDWAVNAKGEKVQLPGIDFVKVYTGVNQEAGWLGEVSTEIAGASDLHLSGSN